MFKEERKWGDNRDPRLISPAVAIVGVVLIVLLVTAVAKAAA